MVMHQRKELENSKVFSDGGNSIQGISVATNVGKNRFGSFRRGTSADINSAEIKITTRTVVCTDGEPLSAEQQLDILASYQESMLQTRVSQVISNAQKFLASGNVELDVRYITSGDANDKAREWLRTALFHSLCGVGNSFTHDGKSYHVMTNQETVRFTGSLISEFSEGKKAVALNKSAAGIEVVENSQPQVLINIQKLSDACQQVIKELNITINRGTLYFNNVPIRNWQIRESVTAKAESNSISQIVLNI